MERNNDRRKKLWQQREELDAEGKKLWDSMMKGDPDFDAPNDETHDEVMATGVAMFLKGNKRQREVIKEIVKIIETDETQRIRLELMRLIQNSRVVVEECTQFQAEYVKTEQYFKANECRVAAMCHNNLIERLQRILSGKSAFEVDVPDNKNLTDSIQIQ